MKISIALKFISPNFKLIKAFLTILFIVGLLPSISGQRNDLTKNFVLHGKINGKDSGSIILQIGCMENSTRDTVKITRGEFKFTGVLKEPVSASLSSDNEYSETLYVGPGEMKVELTKGKFSEIRLTGSKTQDEKAFLQRQIESIQTQTEVYYDTITAIKKRVQETQDESLKTTMRQRSDAVDNKINQLIKQKEAITLRFVTTHPHSYLSPYELFPYDKNETISLDTLKMIFDKFDIEVQNSPGGKEVKKDIIKKVNNLPGAVAPDFKATDLKNNIITLSQFKGKVVILDFWASWCGPCREGIKELKPIYEKYHPRGMEVIAVSVDFNKKAWVDAVKKDSIEMWYHIPMAEKYAEGIITKDDVYSNYFVQPIPVRIIIDKKGKIVSRKMGYTFGEKELLEKELEKLLREF